MFHTFEQQRVLRLVGPDWMLGDLTAVRVPPLVRQLIDARLAGLDATTRELLQVAALIGHDVPVDVWSTVAGADGRLERAIEEALTAGMLEETGTANTVRFSHALVREALYEAVALTRRRDWHRRIADAAQGAPRPDPDLMAYHLQQARDERAFEWLVRAGERAQQSLALVEAAERFTAAADLLEGDPARARERGWLCYRTGKLLRWAEGRRSLAHLEAAEGLAHLAGDAVLAAHARCDRGLIRCFCDEARRGVEEMVEGLEALDALPARSRTGGHRGRGMDRGGHDHRWCARGDGTAGHPGDVAGDLRRVPARGKRRPSP